MVKGPFYHLQEGETGVARHWRKLAMEGILWLYLFSSKVKHKLLYVFKATGIIFPSFLIFKIIYVVMKK